MKYILRLLQFCNFSVHVTQTPASLGQNSYHLLPIHVNVYVCYSESIICNVFNVNS